jgi:ribosomal protein S27E
VDEHFETFEQVCEDRFERRYGFFRPYVKRVIYRYLDCGIPKNGFSRVRCGDCGHEYLLAFSCKRRHFCPSCHQKRVVEFGERLCQELVKAVPHPHVVLSIPKILYCYLILQQNAALTIRSSSGMNFGCLKPFRTCCRIVAIQYVVTLASGHTTLFFR